MYKFKWFLEIAFVHNMGVSTINSYSCEIDL